MCDPDNTPRPKRPYVLMSVVSADFHWLGILPYSFSMLAIIGQIPWRCRLRFWPMHNSHSRGINLRLIFEVWFNVRALFGRAYI